MGRCENVEVFKDTEKLVKTNARIKATVRNSTDKIFTLKRLKRKGRILWDSTFAAK